MATAELERCELADREDLRVAVGIKIEQDGGITFSAIAVDRNKQPNRRGFIFDWDNPDDVKVDAWKANPVLLYLHNDEMIPIGWIDDIDITRPRVRIRGRIPNLSSDPDMAEYDRQVVAPVRGAVRAGLLKAVSIGFYILRSEKLQMPRNDDEGGPLDVVKIKSFEIVELSICPIGAHETALIEQGVDGKITAEAFKSFAGHFCGATWRQLEEADRRLYRLSLDGSEAGAPAQQTTDKDAEASAAPDLPSAEEQPYSNEHACRLNDPGKYKRFARKNGEREHDGKPIDVIYGITDAGKAEVQALRYPKAKWSVGDAAAHCKDEGGSFEAAKAQAIIDAMRLDTEYDLKVAMSKVLGARGGLPHEPPVLEAVYEGLADCYRVRGLTPPAYLAHYSTEQLNELALAGAIIIPAWRPSIDVIVQAMQEDPTYREQLTKVLFPPDTSATTELSAAAPPAQVQPAQAVSLDAFRECVRSYMTSDPELVAMRKSEVLLILDQIRTDNARRKTH